MEPGVSGTATHERELELEVFISALERLRNWLWDTQIDAGTTVEGHGFQPCRNRKLMCEALAAEVDLPEAPSLEPSQFPYNVLMSEKKTVRLTETVKAAG
jgi:hypothetical protein